MSPENINVGPKLSHSRSMADSLPWAFPSGKPWHQFVGCGCRAGPRMPTHSERHPESAAGWLRSPVRRIEPSISMDPRKAWRVRRRKRRDRNVARVASQCVGSTTGMVRDAPMVDTTSDSPSRGRPTAPGAAFDVEKRSVLRQSEMMSVDVCARNHGYGSTIGTHSPRPLTVGVRIGRARIQEASQCDPLL